MTSPASRWACLAAGVCFAASGAVAFDGRVVGISDGDTVTVLDANKRQHKIRLSGIDAPESGQAFGNRSKQALSDCAFGKAATITGDKTDRYGRTIAKLTVGGIDCNLKQIERGMAWHYKKYELEQPPGERKTYAAAEAAARDAKVGLWGVDLFSVQKRAVGERALAWRRSAKWLIAMGFLFGFFCLFRGGNA